MVENDERIEQLLANSMLALKGKRGRFYPDKNFGSKIDVSLSEMEILAYARQAVSSLEGVCVKSAQKLDNKITFQLVLNEEERQVMIDYD